MNSPYMPLPQRRPAGLLDDEQSQGTYAAPPSAWDMMTSGEKANFYGANPVFSAATQLGQNLFDRTTMGTLQSLMVPGFVSDQRSIARGIDPTVARGPGTIGSRDAYGSNEISPAAFAENAMSMQSMQDAFNADMSAANNMGNGGGWDSGGGWGGSSGGWGGSDFGGIGGQGDPSSGIGI